MKLDSSNIRRRLQRTPLCQTIASRGKTMWPANVAVALSAFAVQTRRWSCIPLSWHVPFDLSAASLWWQCIMET